MDEVAEAEAENERFGLADGFEEYSSPTGDEWEIALADGLVVLDTNVLLNLYRYEESARDQFLGVLEALEARLFIPHQVAVEFWRNRENVLDARHELAEDVISRLSKLLSDAEGVIGEWRNRSGASGSASELDALRSAVADVQSVVEASVDGAKHSTDTNADEVLRRLHVILQGRVGPAASEAVQRADVEEGLRRVEAKVPPGYKDQKKNGDDRAGDYLVWCQSLRAAKDASIPWLTVVTADSRSDDWFRRESGMTRGPRRELVREALDEAEVGLFIVTPNTLIARARDSLSVDVSDETLESVSSVGSSGRRPTWSASAVQSFLDRLRDEGPVQFAAVVEAARNDGFVARERVYELGDFDPDRTLRGFTRPATRIAQEMVSGGDLERDVTEPLTTLYESPDSYVLASGFRVPDEFVEFLHSSSIGRAAGEVAPDSEAGTP